MQLQKVHLQISLWNMTFHLDWTTVAFLFAFFFIPSFYVCSCCVFIRGRTSPILKRCWFYTGVIRIKVIETNRNKKENQLMLTRVNIFFFWDMGSGIPGSSPCWRWNTWQYCDCCCEFGEKFNIKDKCICFCGNDWNVHFGGLQHYDKSNVLIKLRNP